MTTSAKAPAKQKLGKGLSALIGDNAARPQPDAAPIAGKAPKVMVDAGVTQLALAAIEPGGFQPRQYFDEEPLRELADSIKKSGVIQPIIVREKEAGKYQIIAGERRWRASKLAGKDVIPAIVKKLTDHDALEWALVENVQRQDLTAMEEAAGYRRLIDEFSYTQEELAGIIGKSRTHITNMLRLLDLPQRIKDMVNNGALTMGHARALLTAKNAVELAEQVLKRGLTVRQTERLVKLGEADVNESQATTAPKKSPKAAVAAHAPAEKDEDLLALEEVLSRNLGMKVAIEDSGGEGRVVITFQTLQQLDKVLQRLGGRI